MSPANASGSTAGSSLKTLRLAIDGPRATVVLASAPLNIINLQMMGELLDVLAQVARSPAKVLVLRGEGKCFSAGADVKEHLPSDVGAMLGRFRDLALALSGLEIPTVAYLHGCALGGGLELALLADLIYAAPATKIGQPEICLGVMAPVAAAYLPSQIGARRTNDLLLSGRMISAEEARSWALINDVVDEAAFEKAVGLILERSRPALLATKKAIQRGRRESFEAAAAGAVDLYLNELMKASDPVEGLNAFLERRPPRFQDR